MQYAQPKSEHFSRLKQMSYISAAEMPARRTSAALFYRPFVQFELRVKQIQFAVMRIDMSVPSVPARIYAVEEVHAPFNTFKDICRGTYAHQVYRLILRKMRHCLVKDPVHLLVGFSNRKASDSISVEVQR